VSDFYGELSGLLTNSQDTTILKSQTYKLTLKMIGIGWRKVNRIKRVLGNACLKAISGALFN
jgi:hypothetical protein